MKSKTTPQCTPWCIQRCIVEGGKIRYDYMGSTEFEIGEQPKALKRIFAAGIEEAELTVQARDGGQTVTVYMVAGKGFDFAAYQPLLQRLADGKLRLQEPTYFVDMVNALATKTAPPSYQGRINAWFDFTSTDDGAANDVLWTLSREDQRRLTAALRSIQSLWAKKVS